MNVVEIIILVLGVLGAGLPFFPNVDVRAAFVCLGVAVVLIALDLGSVISG